MASVSISLLEELWFADGGDDDAEAAAAQSMVASAAQTAGARPFPHAVQQVLTLSRDPNAEVRKVAQLIESDAALSARVLQLVNSAAMATAVRCTSINHAVALLGMKLIAELATAAAALDLFDEQGAQASTLMEHATVVGGLARHLASICAIQPDDVYTCALMHDLGKLFLLQQSGDTDYQALLSAHEHEADQLHLVEREKYGYDHAVLAAHVLRAWQIPDPVPKVVAWHHQPARALEGGQQVARLVALVRTADRLAYAIHDDADAEEISARIAADASAEYIGLRADQLARNWMDLQNVADGSRDPLNPQPAPRRTRPADQAGGDAAHGQPAREKPPVLPRKQATGWLLAAFAALALIGAIVVYLTVR
ncbi:MAG: HDOD domain-containing protein [Deltaproteobacteria bacterium]|nr:HDOD domain-containing protein [Deltaproteobacteria bacterium]